MRLTVSPGISLEARVAPVPGAATGIVICHPHPLYGGDMDNPVVVRVAEVGAEAGVATLRFNFRGVGGSTGSHGGGGGEQDDVGVAMDWLTQHVERVGLVGYSFGAAVSAAVAARRSGVAGLALIAPPIGAGAWSSAEGGLPAMLGPGRPDPLLLVAGDADEHCPVEALRRLQRELPGVEVQIIPGTNHFFSGKLFLLGEAIREWTRRLAA